MKRVLLCLLIAGMSGVIHAQKNVQQHEQRQAEASDKECIAKFLQDLVSAVQYTAQDAINEQQQKAQIAAIIERITSLENQEARDDKDHIILEQVVAELKQLRTESDADRKDYLRYVLPGAVGIVSGALSAWLYLKLTKAA